MVRHHVNFCRGRWGRRQVKNITDDYIYKSTQNLLRTLIVLTQGISPMALADSMMTMMLTYYDDVTPADYEPAVDSTLLENSSSKSRSSFKQAEVTPSVPALKSPAVLQPTSSFLRCSPTLRSPTPASSGGCCTSSCR